MAEPSIARLLLDAAQQDARTVTVLAPLQDIGDAIVGFHAQQAVEKGIKAVLSSHNVVFRRTHDIAELLDLLADNQLPAPPRANQLDELNPYAVEARYGVIPLSGLNRDTIIPLIAELLDWAATNTRG